jgi:hypothetical protein
MPTNAHVRTPQRGRPENDERGRPENNYGINNQKYNATIGDAMDWFKTMTTNGYICGVKTNNWQPFNKKLWQHNYWEHIIRNQQSYLKITIVRQKIFSSFKCSSRTGSYFFSTAKKSKQKMPSLQIIS